VEILLTIAVIMLAAGTVLVNLGGITPSERIRAATRNLAGMSDFIRSQAAGAKVNCYFDIDFDLNRYRWRMEPPLDELGRPVDDGRVMSIDEVEEWRESFEWEDLPRDVYFQSLSFNNKMAYDKDWQWIEYRPDGTISSYVLLIGAKNGDEELKYSISVNGLSGKSEVFRGWIGMAEATESDFTSVMGDGVPGAVR